MFVTCERTSTTALDAPVVTFTRLKMLSLQDLNVSQHIRGFYVELRYESSTPTSKELSSSIFQSLWFSESVSEASVSPAKSPLSSIYKDMNALFWPSHIN